MERRRRWNGNIMMGIRPKSWVIGLGAVALVAGLAACGQKAETGASAPQEEEKSFSLTPASAPVKIAFLEGELQDMKVTDRVERGTGKVVELPRLQATLKLKNSSKDQAARLVAGRIEYTDAEGKPIPLPDGRGDTSFEFAAYPTERLDPGKETSQQIEVPFPAAALMEKKLWDVRLELTYADERPSAGLPDPHPVQGGNRQH